jgi:glycyl-tRNA synthetase
MEIEYFVSQKDWYPLFDKWLHDIEGFLELVGVDMDRVHRLEVPESDRAHYSKRTVDIEFDYPIGREELLGVAYRTDYDLKNIERESGKNVEYRPKDGGEPFVPHVIEPSFGVERLIMAILVSAYTVETVDGKQRIYLKLPNYIAPVRYIVSPLLKNKPELVEKARALFDQLKEDVYEVMWDDSGNIGKRYAKADEIGVPECIVVDFTTLEDDTVTVRNRDTTEQKRVKISELV